MIQSATEQLIQSATEQFCSKAYDYKILPEKGPSISYIPDEGVAKLFAKEVFDLPWVKAVAHLSQENGLHIWTFMADVEDEEQQKEVLRVEEDFFKRFPDRDFGFQMVPADRQIPNAVPISRP